MEINVKKTCPAARIPVRSHNDDFCYDVWAISEEEIAPGVWKYGIGLAFEIDRKHSFTNVGVIKKMNTDENTGEISFDKIAQFISLEGFTLSIDFRPRSSIYKTGMILSNCEGTIDEGYRGEISAIFYHVKPKLPRYRTGDRIGQIKLGLSLPIIFHEVAELSKTERGEQAYGSTGK